MERTTPMGREYERLFKALPVIQEPAYLCERVLVRVSRERVRLVRTRLVFSSCTTALSLVGVVFAVRAFLGAASASGFSSYASLLVSDSGAVLSHGQTFFLTLLESLPGIEVMFTLALLAVLIQSLRVMIASGIEWAWASPTFA